MAPDHTTILAGCALVCSYTADVAVVPPNIHPSIDGSSVNRLPFELLAEILVICMAIFRDDRPYEREIRLLRIGEVCSYWRHIIKSIARLWTMVRFWHAHVDDAELDNAFRLLEDHLRLSKKLPIRITIQFDTPHCARLQQILFPHLHRCRRLRLVPHRPEAMARLLPLPGAMLGLKDLIIQSHGNPLFSYDKPLSLFGEGIVGAPSLRRLVLNIVDEGGLPLTINVGTARLETVDISLRGTTRAWFDAGGVLGPDSAVKRLILHDANIFYAYPNPAPWRFTLPNVVSLQVESDLALRVRDYISTPNLQHLGLHQSAIDLQIPFESPVVSHWSVDFRLHTLELARQFFAPPNECDILSDVFWSEPSLRQLVLDSTSCTAALEALFSSPIDLVLPNLRNILINRQGLTRDISLFSLTLLEGVMKQRPNLHVALAEACRLDWNTALYERIEALRAKFPNQLVAFSSGESEIKYTESTERFWTFYPPSQDPETIRVTS